jgi:oxygen-independent coproporphyrinogen-3 oxidase
MVELPLLSKPLSDGRSPPLPPLRTGNVNALYVHVPFCFHKCHYCDFYSITRQTPQRMERFVDRVLTEADGWTTGQRGPNLRPSTIFFGGGTPSLLPLEAMRRLLIGLRERFDFSAVQEWTVEVNPATADGDYCLMLAEHGVNRLSFGAQSFDRAELALLERHHDPDDVPRSLELARAAGFRRLNLDLIFALPGQSLQSWMASLERAISLGVDHLSCYALTYEQNTPMAVRLRMKQFEPAADALELEMLHATRDRLRAANLPAYEVSNFAAAGQACLHNLNYWTGGDYIGLGPSAASHVAGTRWRSRPHLGEWERAVDDQQLPVIEVETLSPLQRAGELAMLMLRLETGLQFERFEQQLDCDARSLFRRQLEQLAKLELMVVDAASARLTRRGLAVADAVAVEFLQG